MSTTRPKKTRPSLRSVARRVQARAARRSTRRSLDARTRRPGSRVPRRLDTVSGPTDTIVPLRTLARQTVLGTAAHLGLKLTPGQLRRAIDREERARKAAPPTPAQPKIETDHTQDAVRYVNGPTVAARPLGAMGGATPAPPRSPYHEAGEIVSAALDRLHAQAHRLIEKLEPALSAPNPPPGNSALPSIEPHAGLLALLEGVRLQIVAAADLIETTRDRLVL